MLEYLRHSYRCFPVTTIFIVLSVLFSVITWFGYVPQLLYWFVYDPTLIQSGQIWRLITPIFLHFPALGVVFSHLAFNMIWLYFLGTRIEKTDSSLFLLLLIMVSGIFSDMVQAMFTIGIFGGMSGVVYALVGYLFVQSRMNVSYPVGIPTKIFYVLFVFMLVSTLGVFGGNIANAAHWSGCLVGISIAFIRLGRLTRKS